MLAPRLEVGDGHLHRLDLLLLGRDGADLVAHLVALQRHVLALDAGKEGGGVKGYRLGSTNVSLCACTGTASGLFAS